MENDVSDKEYKEFEDSLSDEDYGFIICGKTGSLKGLWIPQNLEGDSVPETIINICIDYFGIDPEEFADEDTMGEPLTRSIH